MASPPEPATPPPAPGGPLPQQTPISVKTAAQSHSNNIIEDMDKTYSKLGYETKGHYLVGLQPHRFLEEFLPWNRSTPACYRDKPPSTVRQKKLKGMAPKPGETERVMYQPFVDALNTWVDGKALKTVDNPKPPALRFLNTRRPDVWCKNLNPDISTYWKDDLGESTNFSCLQTYEEFKPDISHDPFQHKSDEGPRDSKVQATVEGTDEGENNNEEESEQGKNDEAKEEDDEEDKDDGTAVGQADGTSEMDRNDAADNPPTHELRGDEANEETRQKEDPRAHNKDAVQQPNLTERDGVSSNHTRGQIAAYAGVALSMAFRKHLFSVLILGQYARFIRWDRCGAIVTSRFDYTKEPNLIFNFYLRYGQLDSLQRGFDPCVKLCQLPESVKDAFSRYHESSWYGGFKFFKRHEAYRYYDDFFNIEVKDHNQNSETFFVPPPKYNFNQAHLFPFCRGTRRSLACLYRPGVEVRMCFLKDSWQVNSSRTAREAVIYQKLKDADVKNVASMHSGGDVEGFATETQEWITELYPASRLGKKMFCHRIILNTVADDLSTFIWCKVLMSCIADAIEAAQQAYSAGILHRDISAGNIMIVRDKETKQWKGILIDWDMCLLLEREGDPPRTGRTGTWAFISAKILQNPSLYQHTLSDDMESAFWVLVYQALRFLRHRMSPYQLYIKKERLFHEYSPDMTGAATGGDGKRAALLQCSSEESDQGISLFDKHGLNALLDKLGPVLYDRYKRRSNPRFDLDNPKNTHLTDLLRKAAMEMEPLCITPTGLNSPTNDSKPPADRSMWETASFGDSNSRQDYFVMLVSKDPTASQAVQKRQQSELDSSCLHGMNGSYVSHSSKRNHNDGPAPDAEMEQSSSKRRRV